MSVIRRITKSQLVYGSVLIFLANNAVNFGNFLYNLLMGRFLEPRYFGDLGAILSLLVLLSVPLAVFQLLIVKVVSSYWGNGDKNLIALFYRGLTSRLFLVGLLAGGVLSIFSSPLSLFLKLESPIPLILLSVLMVFSFPTALNRSVLQGMLFFPYLTVNSIVEMGMKLAVSVLLVTLNFKLLGALVGPLSASVLGYILSFIELYFIFRHNRLDEDIKLSKWLTWDTVTPVLFTSLTLTIFFTADVILVRHFFSAEIAGEYVALSTVGKIIFYAVGPVICVMFPLISSRVSRGTPYILPLLGTLMMSFGVSFVMIFIYFLFPKLILTILYNDKYYTVIPYLGLFSFFVSLYSINSILTHFLLSISYYKPIYLLFFISLLQSVFIFLSHNSITDIIWINIYVSIIYLLTVSFFVWRKEKTVFKRILLAAIPKDIL